MEHIAVTGDNPAPRGDTFGETGLPRTWYPARSRLLTRVVGLVILAGLTVLAVALPEEGGWNLGSRAGIVVTGVLGLCFMLVLGRPKVVATRDGVTVVNLLRVRRLEWAEIVRVSLRQGDPWVFLDLSDGETLAAMGIQTSNGRDKAIAAASELRDLVERFGGVEPTRA
ncbi:PH domain-containing protein [Yinghuangia sp. ASG 101]|uniref:PH domain-containing protein n=1 Tax=Yinghuangia sp. ASG 101 TaxID=2896848 RepID=UPI001E6598FF|nr:PH domain-containing protein [Yinghuangia sp. ASG 101]UGQ13044.1 PH domain-containing protein [Yinghuangia sp. ASG 101]